jgi:antitoxin component HigA of HigAB toxin-antitoxin module
MLITEEEFTKATKRLNELLDSYPHHNFDEEKELDQLEIDIEKYEKKNYPIAKPNIFQRIKFRLEQMGYGFWLR